MIILLGLIELDNGQAVVPSTRNVRETLISRFLFVL